MKAAAHVDWLAVRAEWENTDISTRALAKRWGMTSDNSIRRKKDKENWTRNPEALAAAAVQGVEEDAEQGPEEAEEDAHEVVGPVRGDVRARAHGVVRTEAAEVEPQQNRAVAQDDVRAEGAKSSATGGGGEISHGSSGRLVPTDDLARHRAAATRRQMRMGYDLLNTAEVILEHMRALFGMDADDPDSVDRAAVARAALQAVNMEKETAAGLMKAASEMTANGTKLVRQALAMDLEAAAAEPPVQPGARLSPQNPMAAFDSLPLELKLKLREHYVAVQHQRQTQVTIEGSAS